MRWQRVVLVWSEAQPCGWMGDGGWTVGGWWTVKAQRVVAIGECHLAAPPP